MSLKSCYFRSIELTNIKSFGEKAQNLSFVKPSGVLSQWTLLLGDNGVGKTTILQCLTEMCADFSSPLGIPHREDEAIHHVPRILRFVATHGLAQILYNRVSAKKASIKVTLTSDSDFESKPKDEGSKNIQDVTVNFSDGHFSSCNSIPEEFASLQPFGYGAFRRFGKTTLGAELNPDPCATLFEDNEPLLNVEEWLLRSDYAATKSKEVRAQKKLEKIKKLLVQFLPEVTSIRIKASGSEVPTPEAKTPDGWVPVQTLSTGYRATMAWVTDFAARMLDRYPESQDPFAEPAVVLVDQIDTHLHPKWQRFLVRDLSQVFKKTQFIVTAHSPLMAQAMPEANIVLLKRLDDQVVIRSNPEDIRGWRLDQIIASELFEGQPTRDVSTDELLEERHTLILKGKLTAQDKRRLAELNKFAAGVPSADAPEDIRAMELIRQSAEKLKKAQ